TVMALTRSFVKTNLSEASFSSGLTSLPAPKIFMPTTALPFLRAVFNVVETSSTLPSHIYSLPHLLLTRAKITSTHGCSEATFKAPRSWHDTPTARTSPFCFRSESSSRIRSKRVGHLEFCMQWMRHTSRWSVPSSLQKRLTSSLAPPDALTQSALSGQILLKSENLSRGRPLTMSLTKG